MPQPIDQVRASRAPSLPTNTRRADPLRATKEAMASRGLLLALGAAFAITVTDYLFAITPWVSGAITGMELLAMLPWGWVILTSKEHGEDRESKRWLGRLAQLLTILLVIGALVQKANLLYVMMQGSRADLAPGYRSFVIVAFVVWWAGTLGRGDRAQRFLSEAADHPARSMALSFGVCAFLGGFLLSLPQAVHHFGAVTFLDGLFTATSAVCVTGLTVLDVSGTFTFFGQIVIAVLVQIGGLGIMALSASFAVLAGRALRVKRSAVLAEMLETGSMASLRRALIGVVGYTFFCELCGAVALYYSVGGRPEVALGPGSHHMLAGAGDRVWWAVFHSISAFCNAGFSLSHGGLSGFAQDWPTCTTVSLLIVVGGLGFPVIDELTRNGVCWLRGERAPRLSLHARIALRVSGLLIAIPALVLLVLEWNASFDGLPWPGRVLAAIFQSVTLRTAGFNTVDIGSMRAATLFLLCVVMFIGASPGSTGGGIKTTTFAALFASLRAELRGAPAAHLLDRELSRGTVRRATAVTILSVGLVFALSLVLMLTEDADPLQIVFEATSAFSTCGLSAGLTPELSAAGRLTIIIGMLAGRIGPLTLALAMASQAAPAPLRLVEEKVMVG